MSTYVTTWQCYNCRAIVRTVQKDAGFVNGYGSGQLKSGPCPCGDSHDWHEITEGEWV